MRATLCLICMLVFGADMLSAQRGRSDRPSQMHAPIEFGVRGGYDFDRDTGSAGAQFRIPLVRQVAVVPSADVFFAEDGGDTDWQINADLMVKPDGFGGIYGGAGAAFLRSDFDGDNEQSFEAGYNLFVGVDGGRLFDTRLRPFAEARWSSVDNRDPFRLAVGINTPVR